MKLLCQRVIKSCMILVIVTLVMPTGVQAWDTKVDGWQSIYLDSSYKPSDREVYNEHPYIADLALGVDGLPGLSSLGVGQVYGLKGRAHPWLMDLNISLFRSEFKGGKHTKDDHGFELRELPTPAHFAGLPDYSYSMYDWLNKNKICPPIPEGAPRIDLCHEFIGWMGIFNANHFGTQAKETYRRLHRLALHLARRANGMRKKVKNNAAELKHYTPVLKEMEFEAMAYEGYAQHFLSDVWSTGHMWERWNGNDWASLDYQNDFLNNMAVAGISGLMHGSESIRRMAKGYIAAEDFLSSPYVGKNGTLVMPEWTDHTGSSPPFPGVGDYRLYDMLNNSHRPKGTKKSYPMDVSYQRTKMMECSKAGWASVIRGFGSYKKGWGINEAPLVASAPEIDLINSDQCFDVWVTNDSIYKAWTKDGLIRSLAYAQVVLPALDALSDGKASKLLNLVEKPYKSINSPSVAWFIRTHAPAITAKIRLELERDKIFKRESSTTLAQGALGSLGMAKTGEKQERMVADYTEPEPVSSRAEPPERSWAELPERDKQHGKDQLSMLLGVFHRSHADFICKEKNMTHFIEPFRQSDKPKDQAACRYLASMAYQGTLPEYQGEMKEKRTHNGSKEGKEIRSICSLNGAGEDKDSDNYPLFLDQGYVARPYFDNQEPYDFMPATYASVAYWCARRPVILLSDEPKLRDENIVLEIKQDTSELLLTGYNFGRLKGTVRIIRANNKDMPALRIQRWADQAIELQADANSWEAGKEYRVEIVSNDGRKSVGLFKLKVKGVPEVVMKKLDLNGLGPCRTRLDDIKIIDLMKSLPENHSDISVDFIKRFTAAYDGYYGKVADALDKQAVCMEQRWNTFQSGQPWWFQVWEDRSLNPSHQFYLSYINITHHTANYLRQIAWELKGLVDLAADSGVVVVPAPGAYGKPFGWVTEKKLTSPLDALDSNTMKLIDMMRNVISDPSVDEKFKAQMVAGNNKNVINFLTKRFSYFERLIPYTVAGLTAWSQIEYYFRQELFPAIGHHLASLPSQAPIYKDTFEPYISIHEQMTGNHFTLDGVNGYAFDFDHYMMFTVVPARFLLPWPAEKQANRAKQRVDFSSLVNPITANGSKIDSDNDLGIPGVVPKMPTFSPPVLLPPSHEIRPDKLKYLN